MRRELVRGVLHETLPSGHRQGKIAVNFVTELVTFVRPRGLGTVVVSDSGIWLERNPDTVLAPDVAFTSAAKIPLDAEIDGYAEVVPDLVVEIVSPSDSRRWAHDRAQMWLGHGAPARLDSPPQHPHHRRIPPRRGPHDFARVRLYRRPPSPPRLHLPRQDHLRLNLPAGHISATWHPDQMQRSICTRS